MFKKNSFYYLTILVLIMSGIVAGYMTYVFSYPIKTVEIKNDPMPVSSIKNSDYVVYKSDFCNFTEKEFTLRRQFISDRITTLPDVKTSIKKGCYNQEVLLKIPAELPPGRYKIRFTLIYKIGGFRQLITTFDTREFEIQGSPDTAQPVTFDFIGKRIYGSEVLFTLND